MHIEKDTSSLPLNNIYSIERFSLLKYINSLYSTKTNEIFLLFLFPGKLKRD